jgi:hypothetical protein
VQRHCGMLGRMSEMAAGDDLREPDPTGSPTADSGEAQPRAERTQTAMGSERRYALEPAPTKPDDVLELDGDDRKTQKVSAEHFRSMRRAVAVRDALGTIKKPAQLSTPPVEHEELASSNLFKEALAQLKAGARLETDSDREKLDTVETPPLQTGESGGEPGDMEDASIDDEPSPGEVAIAKIKPISIPVGTAKALADAAATKDRVAPAATIPMSNQELTEIGAIKPRHAIKMAPITKPPDLRTPRAKTADEVIELDRKKRPRAEVAATDDAPVGDAPRSDVGLLIVAGLLVLGVIATIAILMAS